MKKLLATTAIIVSSTLPGVAEAAEAWPKWYVGLTGGVNLGEDIDFTNGTLKGEEGFSGSASLGYKLGGAQYAGRLEGELSYREHGDDLDATALALNYFYDLQTGTALSPYVGGGIGYAEIDLSNVLINGDDRTWIYQLMAGVGYSPEIIPNTDLTLGYRYVDSLSDAKIGAVDVEYEAHSIEGGVRLKF